MTERNEKGNFIPTPINKNIFKDWYEYEDDDNNDEYMIQLIINSCIF